MKIKFQTIYENVNEEWLEWYLKQRGINMTSERIKLRIESMRDTLADIYVDTGKEVFREMRNLLLKEWLEQDRKMEAPLEIHAERNE